MYTNVKSIETPPTSVEIVVYTEGNFLQGYGTALALKPENGQELIIFQGWCRTVVPSSQDIIQ